MQQLTLKSFLFNWLDDYKINLKPKTISSYNAAIQLMLRQLGNKSIKDLDVEDYQKCFYQLQKDGIAKSTIHTVKVVLNQAYNSWISQHKLPNDYNPISYTKIPSKATVKEVVALTKNEQDLIESLLPKITYGHAIQFILLTGLRNSEFRNLKWEDYDSKNHYLYIRNSKTPNGERVLPLCKLCLQIIEQQTHRSEFIFTQPSGRPITISVLKRSYLKLRKLSGIQTLTIHVLRHSFATRLLENNAQLKVVSALLGHSSTTFTADRYQHAINMAFISEQLSLLNKEQNLCSINLEKTNLTSEEKEEIIDYIGYIISKRKESA